MTEQSDLSFYGALVGVLAANVMVGIAFVIKKRVALQHAVSSLDSGNSSSTISVYARVQHSRPNFACDLCNVIWSRVSNWRWLLAVLLLLGGEISNFIGYMFLPVYLVVMLSSLSVVVTQVLGVFILKEHLTSVRIAGTLCCLAGAGVAIGGTTNINYTKGVAVTTFAEFVARFDSLEVAILYSASIGVLGTLVILEVNRRRRKPVKEWASTPTSLTYCLLMYVSSSVFTVAVTRAVGLTLAEALVIPHRTYFTNIWCYVTWLVWFPLLGGQLLLLNIAMRFHPANKVTPLWSVCYTLSGLMTSACVYRELSEAQLAQLILLSIGVSLSFVGIWMITRDFDRSLGFWPWCCPRFPFQSSAEAVDIENLKRVELEKIFATTDSPLEGFVDSGENNPTFSSVVTSSRSSTTGAPEE